MNQANDSKQRPCDSSVHSGDNVQSEASPKKISKLWNSSSSKRLTSRKAGSRPSLRHAKLVINSGRSNSFPVDNDKAPVRKTKSRRFLTGVPIKIQKLGRRSSSKSKLIQSFNKISMFRSFSDKSDSSLFVMDARIKEVFDTLKKNKQPSDLEEAFDILESIQKFSTSKEVVHLGLNQLSSITAQEPYALVEKGILDILLDAFTYFDSTLKVLESVCVIVWNLATDDTIAQEIVTKKIHLPLIALVKAYLSNESPFGVLSSLGNSQKKGKVDKLLPHEMLLYKSLGALKVLIASEDCKAEVAKSEKDIVGLIIQAFRVLSGKAPRYHYAQEVCIACVQNLCNGPELEYYCGRVFDELGHLLVIRSMLQLHDNLEIQLSGCGALWNMCLERSDDITSEREHPNEDPHERRRELAEIGAGSRALAALKQFIEDPRVVLRALGALNALLKGDNGKILVIIQDHASKKERRGLGKVEIYDLLMEAYEIHSESDPLISDFALKLLEIFETEEEVESVAEEVFDHKQDLHVKDDLLSEFSQLSDSDSDSI